MGVLRAGIFVLLLAALLPSTATAACTQISACNYVISNSSCYSVNSSVSCLSGFGVKFTSAADAASLTFADSAGFLALRTTDYCIIVEDGADNITVRGSGYTGLSWTNCAGMTTAINVSRATNAHFYDLTTSGAVTNYFGENNNGTWLYNISFGPATTGIHIKNVSWMLIWNSRESVAADSAAVIEIDDWRNSLISGFMINNTDDREATTPLIDILNSHTFMLWSINISNHTSTSTTLNTATYLRIKNSYHFNLASSDFENGGIGYWVEDSNHSVNVTNMDVPPIAVISAFLRNVTFENFSTSAVIVSSEMGGGGSWNNTFNRFVIRGSKVGISVLDNTHVLGGTPPVWNCSFWNITMAEKNNTNDIAINNVENITFGSSFLGNGSAYTLDDQTLPPAPTYASYLSLRFLNNTMSRANFTHIDSTNYHCFDWYLEPVLYMYGGPLATGIMNITNRTGQGLYNWSQINATKLRQIYEVREGCANYTSLPNLFVNMTPHNVTGSATGYRNGSNYTSTLNSDNITVLLLYNKPPFIAPNFSFSNTSIEASNLSYVRAMLLAIDPEGDGILPMPNCTLYEPSGAVVFGPTNATANASGVYNISNFTPNKLGANWRLVCSGADVYLANSTNVTTAHVRDTQNSTASWVTPPTPAAGSYSNNKSYSFVLRATDNFNLSGGRAANITINNSLFNGQAAKNCSAVAPNWYVMNCSYLWLTENVSAGEYEVCGMSADNATNVNKTCFQFILTGTGNNTGPLVNLDAPANATTYAFTTYNRSINVTFRYTPFDDAGFTNCSLAVWTGGGVLELMKLNTSALSNGTQSSILQNLSNGTHLWNVLCYDDDATPLWAWNNSNRTVVIALTEPPDYAPVINLDYPPNNTAILSLDNWNATFSMTFNCTPISSQAGENFTNISLWLNISGVWQPVLLNSSAVVNGTWQWFFFNLSSGSWLWNCQVCDAAPMGAQCNFNSTNRTLNITIVPPTTGWTFGPGSWVAPLVWIVEEQIIPPINDNWKWLALLVAMVIGARATDEQVERYENEWLASSENNPPEKAKEV